MGGSQMSSWVAHTSLQSSADHCGALAPSAMGTLRMVLRFGVGRSAADGDRAMKLRCGQGWSPDRSRSCDLPGMSTWGTREPDDVRVRR